MENSITRRIIWDRASKAGLAFGGISIAYMLINSIMPTTESVGTGMLISLIGVILWAVKFFGCIWLMKFFMKKLVQDHSEASNADTFRFGVATALLSALIFSAFYLLYTTVINPDIYVEALASVKEAYAGIMPSESMEVLDNINFATTGFFSQLIYCFLYGTVLSAILSRSIPSRDPFANNTNND